MHYPHGPVQNHEDAEESLCVCGAETVRKSNGQSRQGVHLMCNGGIATTIVQRNKQSDCAGYTMKNTREDGLKHRSG